MENPFAEGENRIIRPPATALVIFGATGDLTQRKLIPALYNLAHDDYLPSGFIVIGSARSQLTDEQFRAQLGEAVKKHSRRAVDDKVWAEFSKNIFYQAVNGTAQSDFVKLKARLEELCEKRGETYNYLYYLAMAPKFFGEIASNLKSVGLIEDPEGGARSTSLII